MTEQLNYGQLKISPKAPSPTLTHSLSPTASSLKSLTLAENLFLHQDDN